MFQCLVVAVRPLYVEELAELLAFGFDAAQGGIPKYCPALRLDNQTQAVLSTCSSLVTIIYESWSGHHVVQFSHFSVKELLVSNRLTSSLGDISRFRICLKSAHVTLTQACLALLVHSDDRITVMSLEHSPLVGYAAKHWFEHAQIEDVVPHLKDGLENLFNPTKPHFAAWVNISGMVRKIYGSNDQPRFLNPVYYSAVCGLYGLVAYLASKQPYYVNAVGGDYQFPLLAALARGHIKVAELLLEHGADINVRNATGKTMLLVALSWLEDDENLLKAVEFLLTHGADVNAQDYTLTSALHLAEEYGMQHVATILLRHKVDVNCQDIHGKTPLHWILQNKIYDDDGDNAFDHLRLLLKHGAEVNRQDDHNETPFLLAIKLDQFKAARILLEHGADPIMENNNGEGKYPLHLLLESWIHDEDELLHLVLLLLKNGADVNMRDKDNQTPLHLAIRRNRIRLVGVLLEHGADANAENNLVMTALHVLSKSGIGLEGDILDYVLLLLKYGAEVDKRDKCNRTLLHLAIRRNQFALAGVLLEHGADPIAENDEGQTPLHILSESVINDKDDVYHVLDHALLLLKHGAEVNRQDKDKETPLHLAIRWDWLELAGILLEYGADANAENDQGKTPLHILSQSESQHESNVLDQALLLLRHGAEVDKRDNANQTPLHLTVRKNWFRLSRILLEHGADPIGENDEGQTSLHILSESVIDNEDDVHHVLDHASLLLKHGAQVNRRDKDKETPLHLAIRRNWFELAEILLEYGADANAENNQGMTSLHILSKSGIKYEGNVLYHVLSLLKHGAEVDRPDNCGE